MLMPRGPLVTLEHIISRSQPEYMLWGYANVPSPLPNTHATHMPAGTFLNGSKKSTEIPGA